MSQIQVNRLIQCTNIITKNELKRQAQKYNTIDNWEILDIDVSTLANILTNGYTVRCGIKVGGNDKESVQSNTWMLVDFDAQSVVSTLQCEMSRYACLWYYTPSYVEGENEKHRLVFHLSRPVTSETYELLYKELLNFYPGADSCSDAGRLFFGASAVPNSVTILNEHTILDVDLLLKQAAEKTTTNSLKENKGASSIQTEGVRSQVLRWINREIWLGKCANNPDDFYCLHPHRFQGMGQDANMLAKWGGHRPEDKAKDFGTGFFVFWQSKDLPPMFQNQGNSELGADTYNFVEYWHHYGNTLYNKGWKSIDWEIDRNCNELQNVCDDIANNFKVKFFDFEKAKKQAFEAKKKQNLSAIHQLVAEYCYELEGCPDTYLAYDCDNHKWIVITKVLNLWRQSIMPLFLETHGFDATQQSAKVVNEFLSILTSRTRYKRISRIDFDEGINRDWIPLKNGDFNIYTKEFLTEYDSNLHNLNRSRTVYQQEKSQSEKLDLFWEWIEWTYKRPKLRQFIIDWLALNCMGKANNTELMVCLWGTPGTGKSVVLKLIEYMLKELAVAIDGKTFRMPDNKFIFQNVDDKYALTIDEFHANIEGWDSLKMLTGSVAPIIPIEKKGQTPYQAVFRGAITTSSQDKFILPKSDDGGIERRVVPIHHDAHLKCTKYQSISQKLILPEYTEPLFCWLIENINPDEAIARCIEYARSVEVLEDFLDIKLEQDDVLAYMHEICIFTNEPEDVVSNMDLQLSFETYLQAERSQHLTERDRGRITQISQYIREKARIASNKINWKLCPEPGKNERITINGRQVKGLRGIRLRCIETEY